LVPGGYGRDFEYNKGMKHGLHGLCLLVIALTGCGAGTESLPPTLSPTLLALSPAPQTLTAAPPEVVVLTVTPGPSRTPLPTITLTPTSSRTPTPAAETQAARLTLAPLAALCDQAAGKMLLSPDGKWVAAVCQIAPGAYAIRVYDMEGKVKWEYAVTDVLLPLEGETPPLGGWRVEPFHWSKDSRRHYFTIPAEGGGSGEFSSLLRLEESNGVLRLMFPRQLGVVYRAAFAPDDVYLAWVMSSEAQPTLHMISLVSDLEWAVPLKEGEGRVVGLEWTAESNKVLIKVQSGGQEESYVYSLLSGKVEKGQ
jgi:hypothetical protein